MIHGDTAIVVDPQRDIDRVTELVGEHHARITHVLETHLHNDYVTSGLELARATGAVYVVPAGEDVGYPACRVSDGDVIDAGGYELRVIHTPGHTREHVSYALEDGSGRIVGYSPAARCCSTALAAPTCSATITHTLSQSISTSRCAVLRRSFSGGGGLSDSWLRQLLLGHGGGPGLIDCRRAAPGEPGADPRRSYIRQ